MADSLKMGSLSLEDSQRRGPNPPNGRGTYIPPHMRRNMGGSSMGMDGAGAAPPGPPGPGGPAMNAGGWGPGYVHYCRFFFFFSLILSTSSCGLLGINFISI